MRISEARASGSSGNGSAFDRLGPRQQLLERHRIERLEDQDAGAREQRRDQLERRVLGGGADQHDRSILHDRKKRILLGAVEAMDLVDEQQRPLPDLAPRARGVEHLLEVGDAGKNRRDLLELQFGGVRQEPRDRRLAGAGRPPEDERAERTRLQHAGERAVAPEQVILADDLAELARPQFVGERTRRPAIEPGSREQAWPARLWSRGHRIGLSPAHLIWRGRAPRITRRTRPTSAGRCAIR